MPTFRYANFKCTVSPGSPKTWNVREPKSHPDADCFEGPYTSYKEDLRRRKGVDADQPHRIAHKMLVRA